MNVPVWFALLVSFLTDVLVSGGAVLGSSMIPSGSVANPSKGVWILAGVAGCTAGLRALKAAIQMPPTLKANGTPTPAPPSPPLQGGTLVRHFVPFVIVGLLLSGCASTTGTPDSSPFGNLAKLTVADLTAAQARATAANDQPAMQCYPVLIGVLGQIQGQLASGGKAPAGVVDAFEAARLLSKKLQSATGASDPIVQAVNLGCAALFNDTQGDILRLGIKFRP